MVWILPLEYGYVELARAHESPSESVAQAGAFLFLRRRSDWRVPCAGGAATGAGTRATPLVSIASSIPPVWEAFITGGVLVGVLTRVDSAEDIWAPGRAVASEDGSQDDHCAKCEAGHDQCLEKHEVYL